MALLPGPPRPTTTCLFLSPEVSVPLVPQPMVGTGGAGPPYTFLATGLPPGILLSNDGIMQGTPTVDGTFFYTVYVYDAVMTQGSVDCSVLVAPAPIIITPPPYGSDPVLVLRFSDDGGNTWSSSFERPLGKQGEYAKRVYWNRLGSAYDRVFEVSGSEPVKLALTGANLTVNGTPIPFAQFCGRDNQPFSQKADTSLLMNLYRETIQNVDEEAESVLYKTPGLQTRFQDGSVHRATMELNNFIFDVIDDHVLVLTPSFEIVNTYAPIANDGKPVVLAANAQYLFIVSGGVYYRASAVMDAPVTPAVPISVAVIDTYVVILSADNQIFWSIDFTDVAGDFGPPGGFYPAGAIWDPLNFQTIEATPNKIIAMIVDHNELWFLGNRVTQVFVVGTDPKTPFVPRQDAVLEQGIAAPFGLGKLDNSLFCLGRNQNGEHNVIRFNGYSPAIVSTYAIDNVLRKMTIIDDAIAMPFQLNGHSHIWFAFPNANQTLGYDATENGWYRVGFWNLTTGLHERHRANTIVSAFGTLLVGDYANGHLYELSPDYFDDDGNPIRWVRRTAHLTKLGQRVQYSRLEVTAEVGVGVSS